MDVKTIERGMIFMGDSSRYYHTANVIHGPNSYMLRIDSVEEDSFVYTSDVLMKIDNHSRWIGLSVNKKALIKDLIYEINAGQLKYLEPKPIMSGPWTLDGEL